MRGDLIDRPGAPEALGTARIAVFGAWLVWVLTLPVERLASVPRELMSPVGLLHLVPEPWLGTVLSTTSLVVLRAALGILLFAVVLGVRPYRPLALAACVALFAYDSLIKSYQAYSNHAQFGILFAAFILALFPAADAMSINGGRIERRPEMYRAPMVAAALVLCLTYTFVGARRLAAGGVSIFLNDALPTYLAIRSLEKAEFGFDLGLIAMTSETAAAALKLGFFAVTVAELLSPLCLLDRRMRYAWLAVIVPFHVATLFTMNLLFWENLLLIAVFMTGLPYALVPRPASRESGPVLFFDGECGLCHGFVQALLRRDAAGALLYAPLQGETARVQLPPLPPDRLTWSIVLLDDRGVHQGSDAVLRALRRLGGAWSFAGLGLLVPRPVREAVYRFVAARRYEWFGPARACLLPTGATQGRILR